MIYPTDDQLLGGIAQALKDTVLPDLARGSAARKQLQAAIETLRRMAFAAPGREAALAADNADMAEVVAQIAKILAEAGHSPPPNLPHRRGGLGAGDAATSATDDNRALQQQLVDLQSAIPPQLAPKITPLLTGLYKRMTGRAIALIPSPTPRPAKTP